MTEMAGGTGAAHDAGISLAELQDEVRRRLEEEEAARPLQAVAKMRDKLARAEAEVVQAKALLAEAEKAAKGA